LIADFSEKAHRVRRKLGVEHVGSPRQHNTVEAGRVDIKSLPIHPDQQLVKRNVPLDGNARSDLNRNLIRVEARM
jgi:hypothetical protein